MFKLKSVTPPDNSGTPAKPKTLGDTLLSTLPVGLTVVATLLAGMSSSAMTQAQYHRSLAAQFQSKAGDQWAFFQAKRTRGINHAMTVKVLQAITDPTDVTAESLTAAGQRITELFQRAADIERQMLDDLKGAPAGVSLNAGSLLNRVQTLHQSTQNMLGHATQLYRRMQRLLEQPGTRLALTYFNNDQLPAPAEVIDDEPQPHLQQALAEIEQRKTDAESAPTLNAITNADLNRAIDRAYAKATAFDHVAKPISNLQAEISKIIDEEAALARSFHRGVRDFADAFITIESASPMQSELDRNMKTLQDTAIAIKANATELNNDVTTAEMNYRARRNEREARDNQYTAGLYEIQVRKSGLLSERHRKRSQYFFYGMLAAQAGVTIASLALAVRLKSLMWSLASIAGITAVVIGAYVHWYV